MARRQQQRRALSKKTRFEVFKRDGFKCQYCGGVAPDVLLQVDHIKPVSDGGANDITNLVTACEACNQGKGPRLLDDKSALEKQRVQLEQLNERRLQLEMMMRWREELIKLDDAKATHAKGKFESTAHVTVTNHGVSTIKKLIRKFGFEEVINAIEITCNTYLCLAKDGKHHTKESIDKAFDYIGRICTVRKRERENPHLRELFYIRGILNKRLNYVNQHECLDLLEQALFKGASTESLKGFAKSVRNWTQFRNGIEEFLTDTERSQPDAQPDHQGIHPH